MESVAHRIPPSLGEPWPLVLISELWRTDTPLDVVRPGIGKRGRQSQLIVPILRRGRLWSGIRLAASGAPATLAAECGNHGQRRNCDDSLNVAG